MQLQQWCSPGRTRWKFQTEWPLLLRTNLPGSSREQPHPKALEPEVLEIWVQFSFHSGLWAAGDSRVVSLALLASSTQVHWPSPTSLSLYPAGPLGSQGRRYSYPGSASQPFTHRFSSAVILGPPALAGTSTFLPAVFFPSSKGCELPQAAPSPEPQQAMGSPLCSGSSPHHLLAPRTRSLTLKCPTWQIPKVFAG